VTNCITGLNKLIVFCNYESIYPLFFGDVQREYAQLDMHE